MRVQRIVCIMALQAACLADFATPFVEINNHEGDVSESFGYLAALDSTPGTNFLAIVTTDTLEHMVLHATARQGVVKKTDLGRWIRFEARITKSGDRENLPHLEILRTAEANEKEPAENGGIPWSEPTNGLQCRLMPARQTVGSWTGEYRHRPVEVIYELRNVSDAPIHFLAWFTPMEHPVLSNAFHVENGDGDSVRYVGEFMQRMPPTKGSFITIEPGQVLTNRVELPYDFSKPGTYRITAPLSQPAPGHLRSYYGADSPDISKNPDRVWTGSQESNEIVVEIVPVTEI